MTNPWLDIPLADYESHMALPHVAQAALLGDVLAALLREHAPASVAVLGCAGGNGFERIDPAVTARVVGVDINPAYVEAMRARFTDRFARLEAVCGDIEHDGGAACEPVALAYAALLFEYVDTAAALRGIAPLVAAGGILAVVLQEPSATMAAVTPSPYVSLAALAPRLRHVEPGRLAVLAAAAGFREKERRRVVSAGGKGFAVQVFRRE